MAKTKKGTVWCDTSIIDLGVAVGIDDNVIKDAAWLRTTSDFNHISIAELEAHMKAIKWNLSVKTIMTDSATVYGRVQNVLSEERRLKTRGTSELLAKRR